MELFIYKDEDIFLKPEDRIYHIYSSVVLQDTNTER